MLSANSDSFTSFPVWIPFISFSSLIAMELGLLKLLNKSDECGYPYLVPDLGGNPSSFFLSVVSPLCPLNGNSFINGCSILSEAFLH